MRQQAAHVMRMLLHRFRDKYDSLQPRVCMALLDALTDNRKPLSTHYGSLVGLCELGPRVVHSLLMPHMPLYLNVLEQLLSAPACPLSPAEASASRSRSRSGDEREQPPAKRARLGTGASVAELTVRRLETLHVFGAALQICGTHLNEECIASTQRWEAPSTATIPARVSRVFTGSHTSASAAVVRRVGTRCQTLPAENIGPSLAPFTWQFEWSCADAPGLLRVML